MTILIDEELDWGWSSTGACETCFYVECQCDLASNELFDQFVIPVSTTSEPVFNNVQVRHEIVDPMLAELDNIEDDDNHEPDKGLTTRVTSTSVSSYHGNNELVRTIMAEDDQPKRQATVYQQRGLIQSVKSGFADEALESPLLRHHKFLSEVQAWARKFGKTADDKIGEAMLKYAELLIDYPDEHNAFYMRAILNNDKNVHKASTRKKREHNRTAISTDNEGYSIQLGTQDSYPYEHREWYESLTDREKQGLQELEQFLDAIPVERDPEGYEWDGECVKVKIKVPEKIKRKIRNMKPPVLPVTKTGINLKDDRNVESEPAVAPVQTRQATEYERLKNIQRNK